MLSRSEVRGGVSIHKVTGEPQRPRLTGQADLGLREVVERDRCLGRVGAGALHGASASTSVSRARAWSFLRKYTRARLFRATDRRFCSSSEVLSIASRQAVRATSAWSSSPSSLSRLPRLFCSFA